MDNNRNYTKAVYLILVSCWILAVVFMRMGAMSENMVNLFTIISILMAAWSAYEFGKK
jgi:adenine C2-methylase RlmN of 23S rRNA A2503 and tRNA A37